MILSIVILGLVTAQRLGELVVARRNTRRLLAAGGIERGADHYPLMVGLHAAWLAGLWVLAWDRPVHLGLARRLTSCWRCCASGCWPRSARRWTTRIIVVPGEPLVRKGPYRFIPHPNYAVVVGEIAVLPLVFGLTAYAAGLLAAQRLPALAAHPHRGSRARRSRASGGRGEDRVALGPRGAQALVRWAAESSKRTWERPKSSATVSNWVSRSMPSTTAGLSFRPQSVEDVHLGVDHRHIAQLQAAQPQERQVDHLAREGLADQGLQARPAGSRRSSPARRLRARDQVAQRRRCRGSSASRNRSSR